MLSEVSQAGLLAMKGSLSIWMLLCMCCVLCMATGCAGSCWACRTVYLSQELFLQAVIAVTNRVPAFIIQILRTTPSALLRQQEHRVVQLWKTRKKLLRCAITIAESTGSYQGPV